MLRNTKMRFKNETKENIKYRVGSYNAGYRWYTVRPNQTQDIPWESAKNLSLTKVEDGIEKAIEDPQDVDAGFPEEEDLVSLGAYRKKLIDIKGIGEISAEQIMFKYPSEEELLKAIAEGEEIHKHDGVDEAVKVEFK